MNGGVQTHEQRTDGVAMGNRTPAPQHAFILAWTTGLWAFILAAWGADLILARKLEIVPPITLLTCACLAGVLLCLTAASILRRWTLAAGAGAGILLLGASVAAILWGAVVRGLFAPFICGRTLCGDSEAVSDILPPTPVAALAFAAWAAGWFFVVHAEKFRKASDLAENRGLQIIELKALINPRPRTDPPDHLWIPGHRRSSRVKVADIVALTAEREYVRLRTTDGRDFLVRASLSALAKRLDPDRFLRIHRSTVINSACLASLTGCEDGSAMAIMETGVQYRVSRRLLPSIRAGLLPAR